MKRCRATEHENSQALWMLVPHLGERDGVGSVSFNFIFGVGGGFWREKQFRLVTSAATALELILTADRLRARCPCSLHAAGIATTTVSEAWSLDLNQKPRFYGPTRRHCS